MPHCKACGYSNRAGAERCEQCGARIIDEGTEPIPPQPSTPTDQVPEEHNDLESRLVALLQKGKTISAVKLYREERGVGSKEAHDIEEDCVTIKIMLRHRESIQEAVRRFRKLVERSGLKREVRRREYYEKPSETKRRARLRAERRARRNRLLFGR
jgi:small subunit ribosomal protein S21